MDRRPGHPQPHSTLCLDIDCARRRWAARDAATRALIHSADLEDAARKVMEAVGECLGWQFGALWKIDPGDAVLRCVEVWLARGFDGGGFEQVTRNRTFSAGEGLPGRVWQSDRLAWVADVQEGDNCPRAAAAVHAGLHGAICFPVSWRGGILGVIEFFSHRIESPDEDLLDMMTSLGGQVGQRFECDRAGQKARDAEIHQSAILDSALDCFVVMDHEGRITEFNRKAEETFGFRREQVIGRLLAETIVPPQLRQMHQRGLEQYVRTGESRVVGSRVETTGLRSDGTQFPVELTLARIGTGRPPAFVASLHDLTERREAAAALRESEERYRLLFECSPHPMWVIDVDTLKFLAVNETAVRKYGWSREEFLSKTIEDVRPPGKIPEPLEDVGTHASPAHAKCECKQRTSDGGMIDVEVAAQPFIFSGRRARLEMAIDITDRRHLEDELRWSQRMEAVGRMAGGVAHDFNNILTAINGYSQLLMMRLGPDNPLSQEAMEIQKATDRATSLTRQLLAFSRRQVLKPKLLSLNVSVAEMEKMLRRLISEDIELTIHLGKDVGQIRADPGQLEQVLLNLAINARDAMPSGGGVTIATRTVTLDAGYAARHVGVTAGSYVMLSVSDTGCGMSKEIQAHIFEPFFTTKEESKGTGLGLATVYGIVKQSGGNIWVYSEPGQGATFKVYLPMAEAGAPAQVAGGKGLAPERPLHGSETILVVEDEEMVRRMVRGTLERHGYKVLEASLGAEALRICEELDGPVDLLVADVIIPQMSGPDLARNLAPTRPAMKVMYMSGYSESVIARYGVPQEKGVFLEKPFTPDALARKVREMLDN